MILSFHPIIEADENRICAGRDPGDEELAAIRRADAVILPQGCRESLYRMARANCPHIFPNLDVRFDYPGKRGQIRLFREYGIAHPQTALYDTLADYHSRASDIELPAVVKLDWGGQGDTIFRAADPHEMQAALDRVQACERTGQTGFLVQAFIPTRQRALRVTVIGRRLISYWRIMPTEDRFGSSVAAGARIDYESDPALIAAAQEVVIDFCNRSGLQLAGFDFIFDARRLADGRIEPLILEINYFFGRTGLGGSEAYYQILNQAVDAWRSTLTLQKF
jgi:ribosomal protein S6--L-glutamate ligase